MKRASNEQSAPVIKARQMPRGKPWPKGNTIGIATRFIPGVCPNPGGRPKSKEVNAACREFLGSDFRKSPKVQTNAEAIVAKFARKALQGDLAATIFITERAEGRPAVSISHDGGGDNLSIYLGHTMQDADTDQHPEGWISPLELSDGEEADEA